MEKSLPAELQFVAGRTSRQGRCQWPGRSGSWNLLLTLAGKARLRTERGAFDLKAGALALVAPGGGRTFHIESSWTVFWVHFQKEDRLEAMEGWPEPFPGFWHAPLPPDARRFARRAFEELLRVSMQRREGWRHLALCLLNSLILRGNMAGDGAPRDPAMESARAALEKADGAQRMPKLAARAGLSRSSFYAKFRAAYGVSPRAFRETVLLRRSLSLLEEDRLTLEAIADRIGMKNAFYYSARFKKHYGLAPSEYRRKRALEG